jgi:integrase/recombinase XerD
MSRLYTSVPRPKLIEAITKLPTFSDWLDQDWMKTPVALTHRRAKTPKKAEREAGMKAHAAWQARRAA